MKLKKVIALSLCAAMTFSALTACSGEKDSDVFAEMANSKTFRIAGAYEPPETAHGNTWATGGVGSTSSITDFAFEKMFDFVPIPEKTYMPVLGESFTEEGNVITIKLRQGVKWNDGTPFTSKDVIATFNLGFINNQVYWDHLEKIEAPDDYTVVATLKQANSITTQLITNVLINTPYHIYGEWSDAAAEIIATRKDGEGSDKYDKATADKMMDLRESSHAFKPEVSEVVGTGPFKPGNMTTAEAILEPNEHYWNPENIHMEEIRIVRSTSLESQMNIMISHGYDMENLGLSPDVHKQVINENPDLRIMLGADLGQPSLQFNMKIAPMDNKDVRQAIHHLIDREVLMLIAEPGSEPADLTSSGMIPSMRDEYLSEEFLDTLTVYNNDVEKAEELFIKAGWSRNDEGNWVDETGKLVELEFATASVYPTFFLCADTIVNQLNEFGIKTQLKAMEASAYWKYLQEQGSMMSISMRPGSPNYGEPWEIYRSFFVDGAADLGFLTLIEKKENMTDIILTLEDGTIIDTKELLTELLNTSDVARKTEITEQFATIVNEMSPFMPLVTKYIPQKMHNPYLTGFPEDIEDPMWHGGGATKVAARLIREGQLRYEVPQE